ncbi:AraC family transcriptional regulator [Variovorax sp. PCZ-1]|uniref:AraC family transcriptional regulator n=1 Tax=Variovorax sp. PCZ-1 TaxID=2835533 RepID=UPI001BCABCB5|nr:AraC family transcriptional regulator [Variovorax sp. PCZ-1]MBS7807076.1 AraC family transcriptional regulator [Variovorax sp. PCZ-1]
MSGFLADANPSHETREVTLQAWRTRVQRVTDWLVDHLDQPFDLDRMAELAHFSPYHFHRVYTVVMNEPIAETMRRMRLHRAAVMLATTDRAVLAIAKKAGYGSVQAFGRVFRDAYGLPPAQYRQHAVNSLALIKQSAKQGANMKATFPSGLGASPEQAVQIVSLTPVRVAALPHAGSYNSIGDSFQKLTAWAIGRNLFGATTQMYGIYYDDPDSKPVHELRSDACISVPEGFSLTAQDAPFHITQTSGGRCARMVFTGPYAELHTAYSWLYYVWLPASGEEPGEQPPIEEYLNDPRSVPPAQWQTAISIPLAD